MKKGEHLPIYFHPSAFPHRKMTGGQPLTTDIRSCVLLWGVGILEDAGRLIGFRSPIGRETIDKYTEDIAVSSQLIQTELGFKPQFDLKSGWRETIQEMHEKDSFELR